MTALSSLFTVFWHSVHAKNILQADMQPTLVVEHVIALNISFIYYICKPDMSEGQQCIQFCEMVKKALSSITELPDVVYR